jgi:hypothetical protein
MGQVSEDICGPASTAAIGGTSCDDLRSGAGRRLHDIPPLRRFVRASVIQSGSLAGADFTKGTIWPGEGGELLGKTEPTERV